VGVTRILEGTLTPEYRLEFAGGKLAYVYALGALVDPDRLRQRHVFGGQDIVIFPHGRPRTEPRARAWRRALPALLGLIVDRDTGLPLFESARAARWVAGVEPLPPPYPARHVPARSGCEVTRPYRRRVLGAFRCTVCGAVSWLPADCPATSRFCGGCGTQRPRPTGLVYDDEVGYRLVPR
jgi:hypothetical protein